MHAWWTLSLLLLGSAAAEPAPSTRSQRDALEHVSATPATPVDPSLAGYIALGLRANPRVLAAHATWEAEVHRIAAAHRLPEPTISVGVFLQSVETRVGPQQARISLQQPLPWPTKLLASRQAAQWQAAAAQSRFDAVVLAIAADIERAYWDLWEVRINRATHQEHLDVLDGLSSTLQARMEVGAATLADLQQVDLSRARLADRIASMTNQEQIALADLRQLLGTDPPAELVTRSEPAPVTTPTLSLDERIALADNHPQLEAALSQVSAAEARTRRAQSQRLPDFMVGADWILTGQAPMEVEDSGKDALAVGAGLRLPLWQAGYTKDIRAAKATTEAARHLADARMLELHAAVERASWAVDDSARKVQIVEGTLLPQAEATYTSLLGSYAVGSATVAQVLLAQRDLLQLRIDANAAHATHARAWATLQALCGTELDSTSQAESP